MSEAPLLRILIVDDDRFMRITIKTILRAVGRFVVEEADDGADALGKLALFRPDLVLCDVAMAPMGGLELVETLRTRADETERRTRVIMITADASEATIVNAAGLQLSGYLLKPVSPKQVASLFRTIFEAWAGSDRPV